MKYDHYGQLLLSEQELVDTLYLNPDLDFTKIKLLNPEQYNASIKSLSAALTPINQYTVQNCSIEEYDFINQQQWFMPECYQTLDIAKWLLDQCNNDVEIQRIGQELLLYQERNLFNLLRYLKYLVDTMKENQIIWGVGRGSSVASFALYKIGIHKINSLYYDLDISEFLKD